MYTLFFSFFSYFWLVRTCKKTSWRIRFCGLGVAAAASAIVRQAVHVVCTVHLNADRVRMILNDLTSRTWLVSGCPFTLIPRSYFVCRIFFSFSFSRRGIVDRTVITTCRRKESNWMLCFHPKYIKLVGAALHRVTSVEFGGRIKAAHSGVSLLRTQRQSFNFQTRFGHFPWTRGAPASN